MAARPPAFEGEADKQSNVVERAIDKLNGHDAVATALTSATACSAEALDPHLPWRAVP